MYFLIVLYQSIYYLLLSKCCLYVEGLGYMWPDADWGHHTSLQSFYLIGYILYITMFYFHNDLVGTGVSNVDNDFWQDHLRKRSFLH